MGKKWFKYYSLIGLIIVIILSLLCSFVFVMRNITQADAKRKFESIYTNTSIDFIIPSPTDDQIANLESDQSTGIDTITPYYQTKTSVSINGSSINTDVIAFTDPDKINNTPYCESRILKGNSALETGEAVVDYTFASNNKCSVGDIVNVKFGDIMIAYSIVAISETNTYCEKGSVALILNDDDAASIKSSDISYSAAYVSAKDYSTCKQYLEHDYLPLGRLKDPSEFSSEDSYNQHVNNFHNADWSEEITDFRENYDLEAIKFINTDRGIWINIVIVSIIISVIILVFNSILLTNKSSKQFMTAFLIKRNGSVNKIKSFYTSGIFFDLLLFVVSFGGLYYLIARNRETPIVSMNLINAIIPICIAIIISLIMISISRGYVGKHYTSRTSSNNQQ